MSRVAFVGLGRMGRGMAGRLLTAGHELVVFNRTRDKAATLISGGAHWADSPREAACGAEAVSILSRTVGGRLLLHNAPPPVSPSSASPRSRALVQLSLRHRWNDIFWFTLFHELGHLLIHSKKDAFINDVGVHSGVEQEADGFASQILIPRRHEAQLAELHTLAEVEAFAESIGIAPGVVVGRLQHDKRWAFNRGNELKHRFVFAEPEVT